MLPSSAWRERWPSWSWVACSALGNKNACYRTQRIRRLDNREDLNEIRTVSSAALRGRIDARRGDSVDRGAGGTHGDGGAFACTFERASCADCWRRDDGRPSCGGCRSGSAGDRAATGGGDGVLAAAGDQCDGGDSAPQPWAGAP